MARDLSRSLSGPSWRRRRTPSSSPTARSSWAVCFGQNVLRLNANGTPDTTFGPNGVATIRPGAGQGTFALFAVQVQPTTGALIVAGGVTQEDVTAQNATFQPALARVVTNAPPSSTGGGGTGGGTTGGGTGGGTTGGTTFGNGFSAFASQVFFVFVPQRHGRVLPVLVTTIGPASGFGAVPVLLQPVTARGFGRVSAGLFVTGPRGFPALVGPGGRAYPARFAPLGRFRLG